MNSWKILVFGIALLATFSSSPKYQLKSYSIGPGGSNSSSSSTYKAQSTVGEQSNNKTSSSTYSANNGSIQAQQLNVPPAPTLSNGTNTFYNKLGMVVNSGNNPADTTYAVAVSTDNFTSTNYVQSDGTIGTSPVYQSLNAWGGVTGTYIIGLQPSTTFEVKVAAKEGLFTNTEYGAYTTSSTVSPSITFSLSPSSSNLGTFLPGTIVTSSSIAINFATNASYGGNVFVAGQNSGLRSTANSYTIPSVSTNLATSSQGFGLQATGASESSGGPLSIDPPYNGTGNNVGADSSSFEPILSASTSIFGGSAAANIQVKASQLAPASADYQEVLTFVASANF